MSWIWGRRDRACSISPSSRATSSITAAGKSATRPGIALLTPLAFDPPAGLVCNTIVVLEHGQIVFTGLFRVADFSPSSEFRTPVVGGTGAYRAAAGQGIVKESSAEDWELTIHLE